MRHASGPVLGWRSWATSLRHPGATFVCPNVAVELTLALPGGISILTKEQITAVAWNSVASGKGVNAARVFAATSGSCTLLAPASRCFAREFARSSQAPGVKADWTPCSRPTRTSVVLLWPDGQATILRTESHAATPLEWQSLLEGVRSTASSTRIICLCGSLPLGYPKDFYFRLLDVLRDETKCIVDTYGEALLHAVKHRPYLTCPNERELVETLGLEDASERSIRRGVLKLVSLGARNVLVTRGAAGVLGVICGRWVEAVPPRMCVVNPVGAGDAFVAGVATALADEASPEDVLRRATAVACASVGLRSSGEVGSVWRQLEASVAVTWGAGVDEIEND